MWQTGSAALNEQAMMWIAEAPADRIACQPRSPDHTWPGYRLRIVSIARRGRGGALNAVPAASVVPEPPTRFFMHRPLFNFG